LGLSAPSKEDIIYDNQHHVWCGRRGERRCPSIAHGIERDVADVTGHHEAALCVSASGAWGVGGFVSGCIGVSGKGKPFASFTAGGGGGSPSGGISAGIQVSNAKAPEDLRGPFAYAGGSAGEGPAVSAGGFIGSGRNNGTTVGGDLGLSLMGNLPLPFEVHGGSSYSWTTP
jgi:hypothetical protein